MQDDLVERCAEAAWNAESRRAGGRDRLIPWAEEAPDTQETWRDTARAIIRIVLEEAIESVRSEHLADTTDEFDYVYMRALHDAEREIRAKMENLT